MSDALEITAVWTCALCGATDEQIRTSYAPIEDMRDKIPYLWAVVRRSGSGPVFVCPKHSIYGDRNGDHAMLLQGAETQQVPQFFEMPSEENGGVR